MVADVAAARHGKALAAPLQRGGIALDP